MKEIKAFEEANATGANFKESGINSTMYWLTKEARKQETTPSTFLRSFGITTLNPLLKPAEPTESTASPFPALSQD